jgi:hypothetical protein
MCRFVGLFSKLLDLSCNNRKSATLFTRSCRFNRSIERKKVRFFGNIGDQIDRLTDL